MIAIALAAALSPLAQAGTNEQREVVVRAYLASLDGEKRFAGVRPRLGQSPDATPRAVKLSEIRRRIAKCTEASSGGGDDLDVPGGFFFALNWRCPGVAPGDRVLSASFGFMRGELKTASFYEEEVGFMPPPMSAPATDR